MIFTYRFKVSHPKSNTAVNGKAALTRVNFGARRP